MKSPQIIFAPIPSGPFREQELTRKKMTTIVVASQLSSPKFILVDESHSLENEEKSIFSPLLGSATQKKLFFSCCVLLAVMKTLLYLLSDSRGH
jgi:hypothetical protein